MAAKGFRIWGILPPSVTARIGPAARSVTRVRPGGLAAGSRPRRESDSVRDDPDRVVNRGRHAPDDPTRRGRRASFRGVGTGGRLRPGFGGRLNGSVDLYIGIRALVQ